MVGSSHVDPRRTAEAEREPPVISEQAPTPDGAVTIDVVLGHIRSVDAALTAAEGVPPSS